MSSISSPIKTGPDFTAARYTSPGEAGKYRKNAHKLIWSAVNWPIQAVSMHWLRDMVFHASSEGFKSNMEESRLNKSKAILSKIGGEEILLETEDGSLIDSMFFDIRTFKTKIEELGGIFINHNGENYLKVGSPSLGDLMRKMRVDFFGKDNTIRLDRSQENPAIFSEPHVMIITQGNACIYEMNRGAIIEALLKWGKNVIVFNIRGTGKSTGKPSKKGTYNDIEAVYQYLRKEKRFSPKQIHVYGYCLDSGPATELAYRHPGANLYDRASAKVSDIMASFVEKTILGDQQADERTFKKVLRSTLRTVFPGIISGTVISYNNAQKVPEIRGKIFALHSEHDHVVPRWSSDLLQLVCSKAISSSVASNVVYDDGIGHCDPRSKGSEVILSEHMEENGDSSVRNFPTTIVTGINLPNLVSNVLTDAANLNSETVSVLAAKRSA